MTKQPYLAAYTKMLDVLKVSGQQRAARLREFKTEMKRSRPIKTNVLPVSGVLKLVSLFEAMDPTKFENVKRELAATIAIAEENRKG